MGNDVDLSALLELATFSASWAILAAGHSMADHVFGQTDHQAGCKGAPSEDDVRRGESRHKGWGANLAHVWQYHIVMLIVLLAASVFLPLPLTPLGITAGLAWSAVTHAIIGRRWPVRWILRRTGSPNFADLRAGGLNGMYLADQALHHGCLLISAILIAKL